MSIIFNEYSVFTQKFNQMWDEYMGLQSEILEYQEEGEVVPESLMNERNAFREIVTNMISEGWNRWQKTDIEMRKDGWNYWMAEDKILRELRYGK